MWKANEVAAPEDHFGTAWVQVMGGRRRTNLEHEVGH